MKTFSVVAVLGAMLTVAAGNSTAGSVDGSKSDLKSRLGGGLGSFHSLGGVNFDVVKYVLSGIQNGASDVLLAAPTQVGRAYQSGLNGLGNNAAVPGYQFARPPPPPYPVPFPPGYRGGGYRGVKSLPVTPVGGGEMLAVVGAINDRCVSNGLKDRLIFALSILVESAAARRCGES